MPSPKPPATVKPGQPPPVYRPAAPAGPVQRRLAPPVYRPAPQPPTLHRRPAPPVYRPLATVQQRPAPPVYRPVAPPTLQQRPAPPVYRPGSATPVQRRTAPPVFRPAPQRQPFAIQPYFTIPSNRIFSSDDQVTNKTKKPYAVIGGQSNFPYQVMVDGSFLEEGHQDTVNVAMKQAVDLRVSDDGEMAIQDTNLQLRQPKAFYASAAVFSHTQKQLQQAGSNVELVTSDKQMTIHLDDTRTRTLNRVVPKNDGGSYLKYTGPQNCQNMATHVTGHGSDTRMTTPSAQVLPGYDATIGGEIQKAIAEYVAEQLGTSTSATSRFQDATLGPLELNGPDDLRKKQAVDAIARDYVNALQKMNKSDVDRELKALGINQFAIASVGQAYVTHSIAEQNSKDRVTDLATGKSFEPKWSYHFAAVVARSGNDTVTFENYARGGEVVGNTQADPRWYFQMYGGGQGQSFHDASIATGGFANPMTLVLEAPAPPQAVPVVPVAVPSNFFVSIATGAMRKLGLM